LTNRFRFVGKIYPALNSSKHAENFKCEIRGRGGEEGEKHRARASLRNCFEFLNTVKDARFYLEIFWQVFATDHFKRIEWTRRMTLSTLSWHFRYVRLLCKRVRFLNRCSPGPKNRISRHFRERNTTVIKWKQKTSLVLSPPLAYLDKHTRVVRHNIYIYITRMCG